MFDGKLGTFVGPKFCLDIRKKNAFVSDKYWNKTYIKWRLNTVQVCKTHDHNLSHILKAHHTVTYVMPDYMFPLFCVSSADVNLWVNGGWDQPNCGITLNPGYMPLFLQTLNFQGTLCNVLIICGSIILKHF